MSLNNYIDNIDLLRSIEKHFDTVKKKILSAKRVVFLGCGGSMSVCGHMAHDFLKMAGIKTLAPESASLLTCLFNDLKGKAYTQWVKTQCEKGDLLIVVSSSGNSECTYSATKYFRENEIGPIVTITGFNPNNKLRSLEGCEHIFINTCSYGIHETFSEMFLHSILDSILEDQTIEGCF